MSSRSDDEADAATVLPAPSGDPSGTEATVAPTTDDTLAADASPGAPSPPGTSKIRAGGRNDYSELVAIDPKHYVIGEELARGGMGRILTARDRRLGRPVAIKELLNASPEMRVRFEREARITAKLQHPAIVNILEAGAWPSGEPFYVMKLVAGRSLDLEITSRETLPHRLGLLPNVIAVVDALAYAHSHRVIHRDLKPANILVGEFGETVVIDWGLAKHLDDPSAEARSDRRSDDLGPAVTIDGSIMGTPAYMPAEQATGESLDERADVYALGAILYHLIAGNAPYRGKTTAEILEQVIEGPPRSLGEVVTGIPTDLIAIVDKAMAHEASARYPSAKELADDLKKFQTGQLVGAHQYSTWQLIRRWVRRHRTPVAVGAVAMVLLSVLGIVSIDRILDERARTEEQRVEALANRAEAEKLISFMVGDLRTKLAPLGKLALLEDVGQQAIAYYDRRSTIGTDDEQRKRAIALTNIGDVLLPQGHLDASLAKHREALAIREKLVAKEPTRRAWQRDLALSHERVGDVHVASGSLVSALEHHEDALALSERLARDEPSEDNQVDLGKSLDKVAAVRLAQGERTTAAELYRRSLAIREQLGAANPDNKDVRRGLALSHAQIADVLAAQGEPDRAIEEYRTSLAMHVQLANEAPTEMTRQVDVSIRRTNVGDMLRKLGETQGAFDEYSTSVEIMKRAVAHDPSNITWLGLLQSAQRYVADALLDMRQLDRALEAYRVQFDLVNRLITQDPSTTRWQVELLIGHERFGSVYRAQRDTAKSLEEFRAALAVAEQLGTRDPSNLRWQRNLGAALANVAELLLSRGEPGALALYERALAIRKALVAKDPTVSEWRIDLAMSHQQIGTMHTRAGEHAKALEMYRASVALRAAKPSVDLGVVRDLANAHRLVGEALTALKDHAGALAEYQEFLALMTQITQKDAKRRSWRLDHQLAHERVANAYQALGRRQEALASFRALFAIRQEDLARDPKSADLILNVLASHTQVGDVLLELKQFAAALAEFKPALTMCEELAARDPGRVDLQNALAEIHRLLGMAYVGLADLKNAAREFRAGLAIAKLLVQKDPKNAGWKQSVVDLETALGACCATLSP